MSKLIIFPERPLENGQSVEEAYLAPASGAPRPLTVRRVRSAHAPRPEAAVLQLPQRNPHEASESSGPEPAGSKPSGSPPVAGALAPADEDRVAGIAASVGKAAIEALGGTRPLHQLARWLDPLSYERLQVRASMVSSLHGSSAPGAPLRLHRNVGVHSCRLCHVTEGIYEASLVITEQSRVRAVALRIESRRGLWKVTALEIG